MFKIKYLPFELLLLLSFITFSLFGANTYAKTDDAFGVVLDLFPSNKHFYARNLTTNEATAIAKGKVYGISAYEQVRIKLYKNETLTNTFEQSLSYQDNIANFIFNIPINAELSNYKIVLIGVNNGIETIEATADEVVAGDVYAINGQSNAVAAASIHPSDLSPFMRSYTSATGWTYINQTFPGQWGGRLAKNIMDEQGVPVAIFNQAQGAQQINYFLRNDNNPALGNYGALRERLTDAGVANKVRAMIWFQGEADSYIVSTQSYKTNFQDLYNDWMSDFNFEEIYLFQTRYQACGSWLSSILEAHRQLANELPDLHIMSTNNTDFDGCHFPYENGYKILGDRIYGLIKRDLYGGSATNVAPPDVSDITVNNNQITITMSGTSSLSLTGASPWADFTLEGGSVTITSGFLSGNNIILNLSGNAAGVTAVSYLGHVDNSDKWIVNPNDIAVLSFGNVAISNPIPDGNNGGSIDCANIAITNSTGAVNVSGLNSAPISKVQVFNTSWSMVFNCTANCSPTENISLPAGQYYVYVTFFNASWVQQCQVNETVTVSNGTIVDNDNDGVPATQDCNDNDPNLPATPGTSCNDNNAATSNDVIQTDGCTCQGTTTIVDNDNDGVPAAQDCNDNDPNLPATPGTSCNDNNATTSNDVIQADGCTCQGTTINNGGSINCANIQITSSGTTLTVAGLGSAPIAKLQVFNSNWSVLFICFGNCNATENITLPEGTYYVKTTLLNSNWQQVCQITENMTLTTGGNNGSGTPTEVDLQLNMTASETEYFIYDYINYTLTLTNNGTINATDVVVENKLPASTVYSSHVASNSSSYSSWTGNWTVGTVAAGQTVILQLKLYALNDAQDIKNFAQVKTATGTDADSTPGNNSSGVPAEDDEATVTLSAGVRADHNISITLSQNRLLVLTNLYPNPSTDILNLDVVVNETSSERVQLYDSFGALKQSVTWNFEEGWNQFKLDVSHLPTGMYYILFETGNRHEPIRFVKQRM